jgi:DNA repair protein RadC
MTQMNLFTHVVYATKLEVVCKRVEVAEIEREYFSKAINSPETIYQLFKSVFQDAAVELFIVIHLKTNSYVTAFEIVSKGTLNSSLVHPREVFKSAIIRNAASIIIAHNHPSGNCEPSAEDVQMTKQLVEAGKILGIAVLDHIIFTEEGFTSLAERGMV